MKFLIKLLIVCSFIFGIQVEAYRYNNYRSYNNYNYRSYNPYYGSGYSYGSGSCSSCSAY